MMISLPFPEKTYGKDAIYGMNVRTPRVVVYLKPKHKDASAAIKCYFIKYAPFRMTESLELPLYNAEGGTLSKFERYDIILNKEIQEVVQAHWGNYLFVMVKLENSQMKTTEHHVLVYDLIVPSHNSYVQTIPLVDHIDESSHLSMNLKKDQSGQLVMLLVNGDQILKYHINIGVDLIVNPARKEELHQLCKDKNLSQNLTLTTVLDDESVKIKVEAVNEGLVI